MKLFSMICTFLLTACGSSSGTTGAVPPEPVDGIWVDVRTPREFAAGHIEGAVNLSHDTISSDHPLLQEGGLPKDQTLLIYCRSGRRSAIAKNLLEPMGYTVEDIGGFGAAKKRTGTR